MKNGQMNLQSDDVNERKGISMMLLAKRDQIRKLRYSAKSGKQEWILDLKIQEVRYVCFNTNSLNVKNSLKVKAIFDKSNSLVCSELSSLSLISVSHNCVLASS
ncbi:hypothetical protein VB264_17010 [Arcicella aquatica]|uniref:Uncharacterized protein n=1 Tax=Arcicella aquatica TaxID=217141 RepID=A0ABU5QQY7_9BACT|nr:hypothetical protein [Arcicella aquatica]MEA5259502.1 hypothetical protein [Arcicella aquatica]